MFDELMSQSGCLQTSVYFPKNVYEALMRCVEEEDHPISNLVMPIVSEAIEKREN